MNLRPSGYEPDELPSCSTPRRCVVGPPDPVRGWRLTIGSPRIIPGHDPGTGVAGSHASYEPDELPNCSTPRRCMVGPPDPVRGWRLTIGSRGSSPGVTRGPGSPGLRARIAVSGGGRDSLAATCSSTSSDAVPSALRAFTAEFGMGSGVEPLAVATRLSRPPADNDRGPQDRAPATADPQPHDRGPAITGRICEALSRRG